MSLINQQKDLESFSDQALLQEAMQPMRGYPPFLVASEIQRRQQDRARVQQQTMAAQAEAPPVAMQQASQFASQMAPEAALQPDMGQMQPEAGMDMAAPMMASAAPAEPVGIMSAAPVQGMAGGGEVKRMQFGREVSTAERNKMLFIQNFYPQARKVADRLNIPVDAVLAQAALESGYGKKYKGANIFGIKADPSWKGDTIDFTTQEVRDGKRGKETGRFRRYSTTDQSFEDYANFLTKNPRYKDVLGTGEDLDLFSQRMGSSGYATDPEYGSKILSTARSLRGIREGLRLDSTDQAQATRQRLGPGEYGMAATRVPEKPQSALEYYLFPETAKVAEEQRARVEPYRGAQTAAERGAAVREGVLGALVTAGSGIAELALDNPVVDFAQGLVGLAPDPTKLTGVTVTGKRDPRQREYEQLAELYKGVDVTSKKVREPGIEEELLARLRDARRSSAGRLESDRKAELLLGLGQLISTAKSRGDIGAGLPGIARNIRDASERAEEKDLQNLMAQYSIAKDIEASKMSLERIQIEKAKVQATLAAALSKGGDKQEIDNLKNLLEALTKAEEGMYGENKGVYGSIFQRLQGLAGVGGPQGMTSAESIRSYGRG